jgi:predicted Kef-type K+ transport protein
MRMPRGNEASLALGVLILAFVAAFILFVQSPAPYGVIDFSPPAGNFTGTTTITTTYGYVCVASVVSGALGDVNGTLTTLTGVGMNCRPELYGSLQVPVGPEIFVVWLVAFAIALGSLAFYLYRKTAQRSTSITGMVSAGLKSRTRQ